MTPQEVICVAADVLLCAGVYACTHPAGVSIRYAACMALLFATMLVAARAVALERCYEVCAQQLLATRPDANAAAVRTSSPCLATAMVRKVAMVPRLAIKRSAIITAAALAS